MVNYFGNKAEVIVGMNYVLLLMKKPERVEWHVVRKHFVRVVALQQVIQPRKVVSQ